MGAERKGGTGGMETGKHKPPFPTTLGKIFHSLLLSGYGRRVVADLFLVGVFLSGTTPSHVTSL